MTALASTSQIADSATTATTTTTTILHKPTPCLACKRRKVKCRWTANSTTSCLSCLAHSLECLGGKPSAVLDTESDELTPARELKKGFKPRVGRLLKKLQSAPTTAAECSSEPKSDPDQDEELEVIRKPPKRRRLPSPPSPSPSSSPPATVDDALVHLGPTSTTARLTTVELSSALSFSLVHAAFLEGAVKSTTPLSTLSAITQDDFRRSGTSREYLDFEQELLFACYVAIGSRRSQHSAILSHSNSKMCAEPLGVRRENASRSLVERATRMLDDEPWVRKVQPSVRTYELLSVVKEMLWLTDPTNDANARVLGYMRQHLSGIINSGGSEAKAFDGHPVRIGFEINDGRVSARLRRKTTLTQDEIDDNLYFSRAALARSVECLSNIEVDPPTPGNLTRWILDIQNHVLRQLYDVEAAACKDPSTLLPAFENLWRYIDLAKNFVQARLAPTPINSPSSPPGSSPSEAGSPSVLLTTNVDTDQLNNLKPAVVAAAASSTPSPAATTKTVPLTKANYAGEVPDCFYMESCLFGIALRLSSSSASSGVVVVDDDSSSSIAQALTHQRHRWLASLRWLGYTVDDIRYTSIVDAHWVARRFDANFSLVPGWIEIAVEAVRTPGTDELLELGDLERILRALEKASDVFAISAQQAQELAGRVTELRARAAEVDELLPDEAQGLALEREREREREGERDHQEDAVERAAEMVRRATAQISLHG